jgi:hypothetical protein
MKSLMFKASHKNLDLVGFAACIIIICTSCEDFVKIDPPRTELIKTTVFNNDETAKAAVVDIYYQLRSSGFASGSESSISFFSSIYSDESLNYYTVGGPSTVIAYQQFYDNTLEPNNFYVGHLWSDMYLCIYKANAVMEGLSSSEGVTETVKAQLEGEAKFIRAFCHFYLVNLFGNVPLITTTDYRMNAEMPRTPAAEVYQQIIEDLRDAQSLLADDYAFSGNARVRANKGAATAMLARSYLYMQDWSNAEAQASIVIGNTVQYNLVSNLVEVFRTNNTESILQLWNSYIATDRLTFFVPSTGPNFSALRPEYVDEFEAEDLRRSTWVGIRIIDDDTYYYPRKYVSIALPPQDYSTVIRLAEVYLIRAEARAQQPGGIAGAQEDINVIRHRAGLGDTPANDQASLLLAIWEERKHELFTEWGHRWLDLKRTGRADAVLSPIKPEWVPTAVLFPIPEAEMINNPALRNAQNPGY